VPDPTRRGPADDPVELRDGPALSGTFVAGVLGWPGSVSTADVSQRPTTRLRASVAAPRQNVPGVAIEPDRPRGRRWLRLPDTAARPSRPL